MLQIEIFNNSILFLFNQLLDFTGNSSHKSQHGTFRDGNNSFGQSNHCMYCLVDGFVILNFLTRRYWPIDSEYSYSGQTYSSKATFFNNAATSVGKGEPL
jgi:hypothetical protein